MLFHLKNPFVLVLHLMPVPLEFYIRHNWLHCTTLGGIPYRRLFIRPPEPPSESSLDKVWGQLRVMTWWVSLFSKRLHIEDLLVES